MEDTSPFGLLTMCTSRLRELISAKALIARGDGARIASILKIPEWKVKFYRTWVKGFTMSELIFALKKARDTEAAMKSGSDKDKEFLQWMLEVCRKRSA